MIQVWAEIKADGSMGRHYSSNGATLSSAYDGGGMYSLTLGGNFTAVPYVLATVSSEGDSPTNRVVSVVNAQQDLINIGIKKGFEDKHDKKPFTVWAHQPSSTAS